VAAIAARIDGLRSAARANQALFDDCISHAGLDALAAACVGAAPPRTAPGNVGAEGLPAPDAAASVRRKAGRLPADDAPAASPAVQGGASALQGGGPAEPSRDGTSWLGPVVSPGEASGRSAASWAAPPRHVEKTRAALHQLFREWSDEGAPEREASLGRVLEALRDAMPARPSPADGGTRPRILVPGAGMGRLVLDCARAGYRTVGNEFSYQMLLLGDAMLNAGRRWAVAPWAEASSNVVSAASQHRRVTVPDVDASEVLASAERQGWSLDMAMAAGDFVTAFGDGASAGTFDAAAACFFLDTAAVPSDYLVALASLIRPGGVLVAMGPLQFHWALPPACTLSSAGAARTSPEDTRWDRSVELTWEEMRAAVEAAGFAVVREERHSAVPYCSDPASLRPSVYEAVLFVAERRL